jgi:hypothetical protein
MLRIAEGGFNILVYSFWLCEYAFVAWRGTTLHRVGFVIGMHYVANFWGGFNILFNSIWLLQYAFMAWRGTTLQRVGLVIGMDNDANFWGGV